MKALTVNQPWASLIAWGIKTIETRSWQTSYRGELAIHASKRRRTIKELDRLERVRPYFTPEQEKAFCNSWMFPYGKVLCVANLVDVTLITDGWTYHQRDTELQEHHVGDFQIGRFAWHLEIVEVFEHPIPMNGKRGIWTWDNAQKEMMT